MYTNIIERLRKLKLISESGKVSSWVDKKIPEDIKEELFFYTKFLKLNPTNSQRIKTLLFHNTKEHPSCVCGTLLSYSPRQGKVFNDYCSISCSKKELSNINITKKFKNTLDKKKENIQKEYDLISPDSTINTQIFLQDNISIFKNGGSAGITLLNKNLAIKKKLFESTTEQTLNGKIYEFLYGKGICKLCSNQTSFLSLENGYSNHCKEHSYAVGSKNKGLNSINNAINKLQDFDNYSEFELIHTPNKINDSIILKHTVCGETFNLNLHNGKLSNYILRCGVCSNKSISSPELELRNWLNSNNIEFIPQYKIQNKRIDIYIPSFNLAIEYDGLMYHSFGKSKYSMFNNWDQEDKNIHLERTILCEKENIKLIHIFENEWISTAKKEVWKSIISGNLKLNKTVYARKCEIREITDNTKIKEFLEENHIQGYCKSSIKLGLYSSEELISIMTFGKPRFNKKYEWELIRYCNKKGISVVGGASKIFKYFIKTYNPINVISYCDRRIFDGEIYEKLGFNFLRNSKPNYFYFKNSKLLTRYECKKHNLSKIISNFDKNKTEAENMIDNDYRRVWDCGNKVYLWEK